MSQQRIIRVLLGKPGLDYHNRGQFVVARALKEAGIEVILAGYRLLPRQIVDIAIQEDVDFIGMSILSGDPLVFLTQIKKALNEKNITNIDLVVGGIIPDRAVVPLKQLGVIGVFGPGTPTDEIVSFIKNSSRGKD